MITSSRPVSRNSGVLRSQLSRTGHGTFPDQALLETSLGGFALISRLDQLRAGEFNAGFLLAVHGQRDRNR